MNSNLDSVGTPVLGGWTKEVISEKIQAALTKLCANDEVLLMQGSSERSICFRLGLYLQEQFPEHVVDCEYNRTSGHTSTRKDFIKRLRLQDAVRALAHRGSKMSSTDEVSVFPDIIIHRREDSEQNLLVIETKKSTSDVSYDFDWHKLKAFQNQLRYRFAVFLEFGTDGNCPLVRSNQFFEDMKKPEPPKELRPVKER